MLQGYSLVLQKSENLIITSIDYCKKHLMMQFILNSLFIDFFWVFILKFVHCHEFLEKSTATSKHESPPL